MWPNPQDTADLGTFTEEILNGKLHFLCSVKAGKWLWKKFSLKKLSEFVFITLTLFETIDSAKLAWIMWFVKVTSAILHKVTQS